MSLTVFSRDTIRDNKKPVSFVPFSLPFGSLELSDVQGGHLDSTVWSIESLNQITKSCWLLTVGHTLGDINVTSWSWWLSILSNEWREGTRMLDVALHHERDVKPKKWTKRDNKSVLSSNSSNSSLKYYYFNYLQSFYVGRCNINLMWKCRYTVCSLKSEWHPSQF